MAPRCTLCPDLVNSRQRICWGEYFASTFDERESYDILVVAKAPEWEENKTGRPLIGNSGQEARHALTVNGIARFGVWLDNTIKCHPRGDRDPRAGEIRECTDRWLLPWVLQNRPRWIIPMGSVSSRFFLGAEFTLEMDHGIARKWEVMGHECVIIPVYHPGAGLHKPETMLRFQQDMRTAADVIKGKVEPRPPKDMLDPHYQEIKSPDGVRMVHAGKEVVGVDTESTKEGPWCLSFSVVPGQSAVVMAERKPAVKELDSILGCSNVLTVLHNAPYDLPILAQMGIHPAKVADTMSMAYLLQSEPQALKTLAYRHCGMKMKTYQEMVGPATRARAIEYLIRVALEEWPDPEPVLEWKEGEPHVRQPQNITKKVNRVLSDIAKGKDVDPFKRWFGMDGRVVPEGVYGELLECDLSDIPESEAIHYSARDADATLRLFPILWGRCVSLGLEGTFWRDMKAMPMVIDMMSNGMPVDLNAFTSLGKYFKERMNEIHRRVQKMVGGFLQGKTINIGSNPQISKIIYKDLKLHEKGGTFKSKKGAKKESTAEEILKRYVGLNPIVQDIMDWRGYQKLIGTYVNAVPQHVGKDGRVHAQFQMTRTSTGRLSCKDPNLMAQPIRSEEGRKVRDCYMASPGYEFLSGDYSQVEMRTAAHEGRDEAMLKIFLSGEDIHSQTASRMFGIPVGDLDEMQHRYPAKRVGFGILYLITAEGLFRELVVAGVKTTLDDCKEMIKSWFEIYHGIAAFMKQNGAYARRHGYVKDMWGRIRYIPGIRSTNKWARLEAERQAGNAPIQMGAQGVIKEAMGNLVPYYKKWEGALKPLIQIHDDIVWEVRQDVLHAAVPGIKQIMESAAPEGFRVPLEVDFKYGKRWGSLEKLK